MPSVNTNVGAMVALQNLNKTNSDLASTQNRVSTGLKVSSAKDNGAVYAIAQSQRATVSSLSSVKDSLSRAVSTVDVASSTGETVQDMLTSLKEKALAASDTSLDSTSRAAMASDFVAIRDAITKTLANASFNGVNLVDGTTTSIESLANADGTNKLTTAGEDLSLGGSVVTLAATDTFASATSAANLVSTLDTSINNVSASLARLGTASNTLERHSEFVGKLSDSIEAGIGNLVDADLAKESAKLQALQTKQQLGIQALSIANQSSSTILSLFQ